MDEVKYTKHIESESYYNDLYDRMTVDECRRHERRFLKMKLPKYRGKEILKENEKRLKKALAEFSLHFIAGERCFNKFETIRGWENEDKRKDEELASAEPLSGVQCLYCGSEMKCEMKQLDFLAKSERILFFYRCPKCKKGRAFYDDGTEYRTSASFCPKCKNELKRKNERDGEIIKIIENCPSCGYENIDKIDFSKKKEKIDKDFVKDKERFCLTEKEGQEYASMKVQLPRIKEILKEHKSGDKKKEKQTKYLTIAQAEELLTKALEAEEYGKLKLDSPVISKDIIVSFTAQDKNSERQEQEYDSEHELRKLIQKTLAGTNWKLMSDGIGYRLGILSGRLRGNEKYL